MHLRSPTIITTFLLLAACGGIEGPDEAVETSAITCEPRMSVFPVAEPHNIGYDSRSCGTGTCRVSCPDQNANSDWGGAHHGIDIFARRGAPLVAVADGVIVAVGTPSRTSGLRVRLRDACGWEYYYGHLDRAVVRQGQTVAAGQLVGYMGNTGTSGVHTHFNVSPNGAYSNDRNPYQLLVATSPTACAAQPPPPPPPPTTPPSLPERSCGWFGPNEYLPPGSAMPACNGAYTLRHQRDGNVVLYNNASGSAVWSSGTAGRGTSSLNMQPDGNLVLYSPNGAAVWSTGTHGRAAGGGLVVHDEGEVVIYGEGWTRVWSTNTRFAGTLGCGLLTSGDSLGRNEGVRSCNGRYLFVHQGDGNVVLYAGAQALWSTRTNGRATSAIIMQTDGNLVLYSSANHPLWFSGTHGHGGAWLGVQDDGNVVVYGGGRALWSTGTAR